MANSTTYPIVVDNPSVSGTDIVGYGFASAGTMKHSITTAILGNDYMAFNVGQGASYNLERMRITSVGNIGINTATPTSKLEVFGGAISSTSGTTVNIATFSSTVSNTSYLNITERRFATGTDWQTASTRIQKTTDVTNQGYIEFNPSGSLYGLAFGTGIAV